MQFVLERSSNLCCWQAHRVQHSRMLAPVYTRNCSQHQVKAGVMGKPLSATGNFGPAAQPKSQPKSQHASSAASSAKARLPRRDSDSPTPQDRVMGKPSSATGNFEPAAQPEGRTPSSATGRASPRRNYDSPTPQDRAPGRPFSATGSFGPAGQPRGQRPSTAAGRASPRRHYDSPTSQGDKQAARELNARIASCQSLNELEQLVEPKLHQDAMDAFNINAVWGRMAKLSPKQGGQPTLPVSMVRFRDQLAGITLEKQKLLGVRQAANIIHSLGTLRLRPANRLLIQLLRQLTADDDAMLWQAKPQELSNMAWSLSQLRPLQQDEQMALLHIAKVAVSRLRLHGPMAFAAFAAQEISNLALAYATADLSAAAGDGDAKLLEVLFNGLAAAALTKLPDFNMQHYANTAWAYAKAGHQHRELMAGIMQEVTPRLRECTSQELSNLVWAVATLDCTPEPGFMPAWAQAARQAADHFNEQGIANSLGALAKLRFYDTRLLESMLHQAEMKLGTFSTQGLANSLLALGTLQHRDEAAIAAMAAAAQGRLHEFNTQGLANTLWALAALDFSHNTTLIHGLLQQLAAKDARELTRLDRANVWQAWCWLEFVKGGQGKLTDSPEVLRMVEQCEQWTKARNASDTTTSPAQREISAVLRAVLADRAAGLEVAQEQQHPVTQQVVDIALLRPGGDWAVAVEVDGEAHFAANDPSHLLGRTALRNSLLRAQELPLVTIPFYEWNRQKGREAQKQYLDTKLDAVLPKPRGS